VRHGISLADSGDVGLTNAIHPPLTENDGDVKRDPAILRGLTRKEFLGKGAAVALGAAAGVLTMNNREANAATKTFTYDPSTIFPNPERGWFYAVHFDWYDNKTMDHKPWRKDQRPLTSEALSAKRTEGYSLVRKYYHIRRWMNSPIPESYFDEHLRYDFDLCRKEGFKLIPRFTYVGNINYGDNDASEYWIRKHIDQIAPILAANLDVFSHLEAGFVGPWGEWHTSRSGHVGWSGSRRIMTQSGTNTYNHLMSSVPANRKVLLRYPDLIMQHYPTPLSESNAHSGTNQARTGMHDDSFMYSELHRGTYNSDKHLREKEQAYQEQMTKYVPMSGEPSGNDGTGYVFQNPIHACERMHWPMMNSDWYEARRDGVYDYWEQKGYYDEMNRRFGYRFALEGSAKYTGRVKPNGTFNMSFAVRNHGFGTPYNARPADLVARHAKTGKEYYRGMYNQIANPRRWQPGSSHPVNVSGKLPSDAPKGTYNVFLSFPDSSTTLRGDGRYSIRLANNETTWEGAKGYNALGVSFQVRGTPVTSNSSVPVFKRRA